MKIINCSSNSTSREDKNGQPNAYLKIILTLTLILIKSRQFMGLEKWIVHLTSCVSGFNWITFYTHLSGVHFQVGDDSGRPRFEVYQASVNYNEIMKQWDREKKEDSIDGAWPMYKPPVSRTFGICFNPMHVFRVAAQIFPRFEVSVMVNHNWYIF